MKADLTPAAIAEIVGGTIRPDDPNAAEVVTGINQDSRLIQPGDCFVPITGDRDGHDFIDGAISQGALAYFCAKSHPLATDPNAPAGRIVVEDPLAALTQLGRWHRDTIDPTVVVVTGSNGKTTTKDFLAAALAPTYRVIATKGSFNNELGMPLTLCALNDATEVLVCEIGARAIGDIASAMPWLRPDIGVVTTIGAAHVGTFGSIEAISQAKGELVEALGPDGVAVLNGDNPATLALAQRTQAKVITAGETPTLMIHPDAVSTNGDGHVVLTVGAQTLTAPLPGIHQSTNLLLALAVADHLGVPREQSLDALATAPVSPMRMAVTTIGPYQIINDAYNANEQSTTAGLATLAAMTNGRRIAVLGMIGDLGAYTDATLARIAQTSTDLGIDVLISVGTEGRYQAGRADCIDLATIEEVVDAIVALDDGQPTVVFIKGSRAAGLEQLVSLLHTALEQRL